MKGIQLSSELPVGLSIQLTKIKAITVPHVAEIRKANVDQVDVDWIPLVLNLFFQVWVLDVSFTLG